MIGAVDITVAGGELHYAAARGTLRLRTLAELADHLDTHRLLCDAEAPEPPYWAHLWPAARVLAGCLDEAELHGRRVIELGCGLGLPGLVAAQRGAWVMLSDRQPEAVAFARRNAQRNGVACAVLQFDWQASPLRAQFDLCLAADVTYDPDAARALEAFLCGHLAADGEVWLAESVRAEETHVPAVLARRFDLVEERVPVIEDGHRVWVRLLRGGRRA